MRVAPGLERLFQGPRDLRSHCGQGEVLLKRREQARWVGLMRPLMTHERHPGHSGKPFSDLRPASELSPQDS